MGRHVDSHSIEVSLTHQFPLLIIILWNIEAVSKINGAHASPEVNEFPLPEFQCCHRLFCKNH